MTRTHSSPETVAYVRILRRDPCGYCGRSPAGTIDHIVPLVNTRERERGLLKRWPNLGAACELCNGSKADQSLLAFLVAIASTAGEGS